MRRLALLSLMVAVPAVALAAAPNDFATQQRSFKEIRAVEAWGYATGNPDFIVAILDSGIDVDHPDLAPNLWVNSAETLNGADDDGDGYADDVNGWNFLDGNGDVRDRLGRGTHVAGVIGAVGSNGMGVAGIAWHVKLLPVKVMDQRHILDEHVDPALGAKAIRYAASRGAGCILVDFHVHTDDADLKAAVIEAVAKGAVVVAAAGDESANLDHDPVYPAAWRIPGVISVASVDEGAKIALSSDYGGDSVTMVAPGVNVFSTLPGGTCGAMSGTAQAAAHVAGAVALYRSLKPSLDPIAVANDIVTLSSNRAILKGTTISGEIVDLGLLVAQKRQTVDAHIVGPTKVRVGQVAVFDGSTSEGPIVQYTWKFGDPADELGTTVPHVWYRPGTVGVELLVRTFDGRTASIDEHVSVVDDDWLTRIGCEVTAPGTGSPLALLALAPALLVLALRRRALH